MSLLVTLRRRTWTAVRRGHKLLLLLADPSYRAGLRLRAPASVEHRGVAFEHEFSSVLDVGANRGQFAIFALRRFPGADLFSFEPYPEAFAALAKLVGVRPNVHLFELALSSTKGPRDLHVSGLDHSSSLLPITRRLTDEFTGTAEAATVQVASARLDETVSPEQLRRPVLLKLDVQGFELEALRGAEALLSNIDEILIELSFVEFYAGQPLSGEVIAHLDARDFRLAGVYGVMRGRAGECLQADFHFVRGKA